MESDYSGSDDFRKSEAGSSFRESTHLIPSAVRDGRRPPRFESILTRWPVVIGSPLLLFCLGLALEAAAVVSKGRGGFRVPDQNVLQGIVTPQFLLSVIPSLVVAPAALLFRELDWMLRWFQPYILLWKGNAPAEESLLLDYTALGPFLSIFRARFYKHHIVFWSALVASISFAFQPLAGSIFQLRQRNMSQYSNVTATRVIGLAPNVNDLNAFVAAAGFADAAVFHNLKPPPFVNGGWATAEFTFPTDSGLNGTMQVNTTGIQSATNCANPAQSSMQTLPDGELSFTWKSVEGCSVNVNFAPNVSAFQYGVSDASCSSTSDNIQFNPVMFWFFHTKSDGTPEAKAVFCGPSIKAFNVQAFARLTDLGSLYQVNQIGTYVPENNVTGSPLNGKAFNGVLFPNSSDPFVQARAVTTASSISGAIFRLAQQQPDGLQATFDKPNGFLDCTSTVYKQHLSLVAKSIYFVAANDTIPSKMTSIVPVLWIDPLPANILAIFLMIVGVIGVVVQVLHQPDRRKLLLAAPPGSIASITALTSRSGFGELLLPYDDEKTLEQKLSGLRFRLDRRTGAIVAEDTGAERSGMGRDDAMQSLLGRGRHRTTDSSSSSYAAYQAAAGLPPWKAPYDS